MESWCRALERLPILVLDCSTLGLEMPRSIAPMARPGLFAVTLPGLSLRASTLALITPTPLVGEPPIGTLPAAEIPPGDGSNKDFLSSARVNGVRRDLITALAIFIMSLRTHMSNHHGRQTRGVIEDRGLSELPDAGKALDEGRILLEQLLMQGSREHI